MSLRISVLAAIAAGTFGCGVIREVPIDVGTGEGSSTAAADETHSTSIDGDTSHTTHGGSGGDTIDHDDATATESTAGPPVDTDGPGDAQPLCVPSVTPVPDDGQWLELPIEQPQDLRVRSFTVTARVTHPRVADLRIELVAPDGVTSALLIDTSPCEGQNINAVFVDSASWSVDDGCQEGVDAALDGPVAPSQPLASLLSVPTAGTWWLRIQDVQAGNEGIVDAWCITMHEGA